VALVGLSGAGKSTVAPMLARRLGYLAVDLDRAVEARAGRGVAELFDRLGEAGFRDLEAAELQRVLDGPPAVVATGGGVVLRAANRERLRSQARVVWLRADPADLADRLAGCGEERPLLAGDAAAALRRLAAEREHLYREVADVTVDVTGLGLAELVDRLERELPAP
jgi:shikimate kinase